MLSLAKAATLASAFFAAGASAASLTPTGPSPGQTFNEGSTMTIQYDIDTTGVWTNTTIELMSGSNFAMVHVADIITNLDGTSGAGVLTWTVPDVTPYSEIYFLQFTEGGNASSATWTGRFTIASSTGTSTTPANSTTTDGTTINWGIGKLKSASEDVATASQSGATAAASTAASTSASESSSAASTSSADATTSSASSSATSTSTESSAASIEASSATSSAPTASATTASNNTSGAGALKAGFAAVAALAVGVVALA